MTELCFNLPENEFDEAEKDIEVNELALENYEAQAIAITCEFDATVLNREKLAANVHMKAAPPIPESKPKFKPRDLSVSKWNGDLVTLNAWKQRINDNFELAGLTSDSEQLAILFYQNVLPDTLQLNLQDCTSVNGRNGVWERLNSKFPASAIPRVILQTLKDATPMATASAREMRRVLEQIKDFARHLKQANRTYPRIKLSIHPRSSRTKVN